MGLDMYLTGERYFMLQINRQPGDKKGELYHLGYWRKHPNLHGFIVDTFADEDDCQPIWLDEHRIGKIINAIEHNQLPLTDGFFFGKSDGFERFQDLQIFRHALAWLEAPDVLAYRSIYYQASW